MRANASPPRHDLLTCNPSREKSLVFNMQMRAYQHIGENDSQISFRTRLVQRQGRYMSAQTSVLYQPLRERIRTKFPIKARKKNAY
eukprot:COSAG05_NODE_986_length_6286_cov_3.404881_7_plen_86_part_00